MSATKRSTRWRFGSALLAVVSASALVVSGGCQDTTITDNVPVGDLVAADGGAASCLSVLPPGCPGAPSYRTTIAPLIERTCAGCHAPGGVASDRVLTSYEDVARLEITELVQLYACQMPPADAGADAMLSTTERQEIMQWLVCGYPDN